MQWRVEHGTQEPPDMPYADAHAVHAIELVEHLMHSL